MCLVSVSLDRQPETRQGEVDSRNELSTCRDNELGNRIQSGPAQQREELPLQDGLELRIGTG
ncbi:MAG TPA: hypothetical protein VK662_07910 [Acidothermaceae bacterium]|nr:hypothetical protein [Acidothermaceae bacterium]